MKPNVNGGEKSSRSVVSPARCFNAQGNSHIIWLMPGSHLGVLTGYLRANACGVSTRAARLPHGPWPRLLLMLWMYAELRRSPCAFLDLVHALSNC